MKTKINQLAVAVFFAVIFICGTTNAKGKASRVAVNLENANEPVLSVENWMYNDFFWSSDTRNFYFQYADENLGMEDWMYNDYFWYSTENMNVTTDADVSLALEPWMSDSCVWKKKQIIPADDKDSELTCEFWMTDDSYWKKPSAE